MTAVHGGVELVLCRFLTPSSDIIFRPFKPPFTVGVSVNLTDSVKDFGPMTFPQLPLIMYPATRRSITPRKRNVGIRPRTFNYYCKLSRLAPAPGGVLTRPFPRLASQPPSCDSHPFRLRRAQPAGHAIWTNLLYGREKCQSLCDASECIANILSILVVIKNQFLHVYAKNYEENGQRILIRIIRYSLDGMSFFN
jgi:hypothetical protein